MPAPKKKSAKSGYSKLKSGKKSPPKKGTTTKPRATGTRMARKTPTKGRGRR